MSQNANCKTLWGACRYENWILRMIRVLYFVGMVRVLYFARVQRDIQVELVDPRK